MSGRAGIRFARLARDERKTLFVLGGGFFLILFAANLGQNLGLSLLLLRSGAASLPRAYIVNAVAVASLSLLLTRLVARLPLKPIMAGTFVAIAALVLLARAGMAAELPWIPGALYVLGFCGADLSLVLFWSFANRVCDTRDAKRLFPLVWASGTLGGAFSGFFARALISSHGMGVLLVVWAVTAFACAAWALLAATPAGASDDGAASSSPGASDGANDRFLKASLMLGLLFIVLVTLFGRFLYGAALRAAYESDEAVTATNGLLIGVSNGLTFLVQLVFVSRLLSVLGVGMVGLIYPIAMAGVFAFLSFDFGMPAAVVCFLAITTVRTGIQGVVENVLYTPLPPRAAARLLTLVTAIGMPAGMVLAGASLELARDAHPTVIASIGIISAAALFALALARAAAYRGALRRRLLKGGSGVRLRLASMLDQSDAMVGSVLTSELSAHDPDLLERLRTLVRSQQKSGAGRARTGRISWNARSRLGVVVDTVLADSYLLHAALDGFPSMNDVHAVPTESLQLLHGAVRHRLGENLAVVLAALHAGSQHGDFDRISLRVLDADRRVRAAAVEILDSLLPDDLRERILPLMEDKRAGDRRRVASARYADACLAAARDPAGALLEFPDDWIRATTAYVLAHHRTEAYADRLRAMTGSPDAFLSFAASYALARTAS